LHFNQQNTEGAEGEGGGRGGGGGGDSTFEREKIVIEKPEYWSAP